jgi:hypothetical protein
MALYRSTKRGDMKIPKGMFGLLNKPALLPINALPSILLHMDMSQLRAHPNYGATSIKT